MFRICARIFFPLIVFLLATAFAASAQQMPSTPLAPVPADTTMAADSTGADSTSAAPGDSTDRPSSQFLLPSTDELETEAGYNLKVNVRMAPIYADSNLVSNIDGYLPRGSVVGVVEVHDNWYKIEYGEAKDRKQGWVISYGVERTHEMEHIVTSREDENRWAGMRVVVVAGETSIRSFPSTAAEILVKAYRNEIFEVAGASEDYYMVKLSNAVNGWVWRGDVDNYEEPKYTKEQIQQMYTTIREHRQRISDLNSLVADMEHRDSMAANNLALLQVLEQRRQEEAAKMARAKDRKPFFQYDSLKQRLSIQLGFLREGFNSALGVGSTMMTGLGMRYRSSDKYAFEFSRHGGAPALLTTGPGEGPLPIGLSGIDSLRISAKFWQFGMRYEVGHIPHVPIIGKFNSHLYAGLGFLTITPQTLGYVGRQRLWGPVLGWGFKMNLFGHLSFDVDLREFLTQTEVIDVRYSGSSLLKTRSKFMRNLGFSGGATWQF